MEPISRKQALYITGYQFGYPIAGDEIPAKNSTAGTIQIQRKTFKRFRGNVLRGGFASSVK